MGVIQSIISHNGFPVELKERKPEHYDKTILIIGVFHGDETEGEFLIKKYLASNPKIKKNRLLIIPCLNPDGKHLKTRQNSKKVDLNRNFPTKNWHITEDKDYFGGNTPGSEIETRFLVRIIENFDIDCILALHSPYRIVNYDGPAIEIAEKISEITGYPIQKEIGYPTPGSFGTYAGIEQNIPVITLELPDNESKSELWKQNKNVFKYFANEF